MHKRRAKIHQIQIRDSGPHTIQPTAECAMEVLETAKFEGHPRSPAF
jgi:hypothetical protein